MQFHMTLTQTSDVNECMGPKLVHKFCCALNPLQVQCALPCALTGNGPKGCPLCKRELMEHFGQIILAPTEEECAGLHDSNAD